MPGSSQIWALGAAATLQRRVVLNTGGAEGSGDCLQGLQEAQHLQVTLQPGSACLPGPWTL